MGLPLIRIEVTVEKRKGRRPAKTRCFAARFLGYVSAGGMVDHTAVQGATLPLYLAFLGTEAETNAVMANLRCGHKASVGSIVLQTPKRAPYRWLSEPCGGARIVTAYLPDVFSLEPTSPFPEDLRFIFLPPRSWVLEQAAVLGTEFGDEAEDVARAALFAAYLDRRTALPILDDLRFHLRLYRAALAQGWTFGVDRYGYSTPRVSADGIDRCGFEQPVAVRVDAETFASFLTTQTQLFYQEVLAHGPSRIESAGRLLPFAHAPAAQLCLDFAVA